MLPEFFGWTSMYKTRPKLEAHMRAMLEDVAGSRVSVCACLTLQSSLATACLSGCQQPLGEWLTTCWLQVSGEIVQALQGWKVRCLQSCSR